MLTVKEINEVSFGKAGFSGYRPEDVDNFIDQVAASFQELINERDAAVKQAADLAVLNTEIAGKNADAQRKLAILAQKIEAYRQEEESIKEAIINAQRMSKDLMKEAQGEADSVIQEARSQAEAKLLEANEEARRITHNAQEEASRAAREYTQQVEAKKNELEEVKRQVTAFRSSLLEMYKKHLECIDHIPVFRQKEERRETVSSYQPEPVQEFEQPIPVQQPQPQRERDPLPVPEPPAQTQQTELDTDSLEPDRTVLEPEETEQQSAPSLAQPARERRPAPVQRPPLEDEVVQQPSRSRPRQDQARQARTLNDRVNYVQEQLQPSQPPESYLGDNGLSSVGIDLVSHSNIPEALRREKSSNYSNLPFGDNVEVDGRRHKR